MAIEVEETLADKPLELARFRQAQAIITPTPGITVGIMGDWSRLRGRVAVLTSIGAEAAQARRTALYFWVGIFVAVVIGIIGAWATVKGWFAG
jgi:hypothetical protein